MPIRRLFGSALVALVCAAAAAATPPSSAFTGHWRFDPARSTNLAAWRSLELRIEVDAASLAVHRRLGWGRRTHEETMRLPLDGAPVTIPVPYWADNRHIGAYIGGDRQKRATLRVLDDGRVLRLESDLVLETQQGERAVNILSDYHLSSDGQTLTLIEVRSTRSRPVIYVFRRQS